MKIDQFLQKFKDLLFLRIENRPRKEHMKDKYAVLFVKDVLRIQSVPWYFWNSCRDPDGDSMQCVLRDRGRRRSGAARLQAQAVTTRPQSAVHILHSVRKLKCRERGTHRGIAAIMLDALCMRQTAVYKTLPKLALIPKCTLYRVHLKQRIFSNQIQGHKHLWPTKCYCR